MVDSQFLMSFDFFGFFCIFYDFFKIKTHFCKKIRISVVGFERPQKNFVSRFVNFPAICDTFPMLENSQNAKNKNFLWPFETDKEKFPNNIHFIIWIDSLSRSQMALLQSNIALCVFFFREVSIGKFAKMSTLPFIFTLTF